MRDFAEFFGWLVNICFGFLILNFILKYINKKYIPMLPKEKNNFINIYRKILRLVVKYHKAAGIAILIFLLLHSLLMILFFKISITGIISSALMLGIILLGILGTYFNKNRSRNWVKMHRILSFLLVLSIIIHII